MFGLNKNKNMQTAIVRQNSTPNTHKTGRRSGQVILVPTLIGSTMVMIPRRVDYPGNDWLDSIPPNER